MDTRTKKGKILYFSHGGGPLPLLGDPGHQAMVSFMKELPSRLIRPDAIIVISAHWEESVATVTSSAQPSLIYDYYGFPEEAYAITYQAKGSPTLATKVSSLLKKNNISSQMDPERGFDHGLFIPLKLMYPNADIPCIQLSLLNSLNPEEHLNLGKALRPLLNENILIAGSGFSFHNLNLFFSESTGTVDSRNEAFQEWLIETCSGSLEQSKRDQRLIDWENAPFARHCHPREEHLLPLLVCAGLAKSRGEVVFDNQILEKRSVAFSFS